MSIQRCLLLFTRYPQVGQTKTRLIPALGDVGAAALQRHLTMHTWQQVAVLRQDLPLSLHIYFTGGTLQQMRAWLGEQENYFAQCPGDLGARLVQGFGHSFRAGAKRVVAIGSDCPDLSPQILERAFQLLENQGVVLGPAQDGGYYLIGLTEFLPSLFTEIHWSTDRVLAQTQDKIQALGQQALYLPTLRDIDRPEDLHYLGAQDGNFALTLP
jgi:hypothetical protein